MNTSALGALLDAGEWRAADEESRRLLLADADHGGFIGLDPAEVPTLHCDLVLAINDAWRRASDGRYGFSAQAAILATVRAEGFGPKKTWRRFGSRVGWRAGAWVDADGLSYVSNAPDGHFPWVPGMLPTVTTGPTYEVLFLFYQLFDDCLTRRRDQ